MKVWLLEAGCYENKWVVGIFSSPEKAMAAWAPKPSHARAEVRGFEYGARAGQPWSYEWSGPDTDGEYSFGADWDDSATIRAMEIDEAS